METWTFFFTSPQRRNLGLTSLNLGNLRIWAAKNRKIWLAKMVWDFKTRPAKLGWPSVRQTRQASKSPTKKIYSLKIVFNHRGYHIVAIPYENQNIIAKFWFRIVQQLVKASESRPARPRKRWRPTTKRGTSSQRSRRRWKNHPCCPLAQQLAVRPGQLMVQRSCDWLVFWWFEIHFWNLGIQTDVAGPSLNPIANYVNYLGEILKMETPNSTLPMISKISR